MSTDHYTCTKCGETKDASSFSIRNGRPIRRCKACVCASAAAWLAANPDRARATTAAWVSKNRERKLATQAAWYAANTERAAAANKAWRDANPERSRATRAAWAAANPERFRAYTAAWLAANPDRARMFRERWQAANKDKVLDIQATRRARKKAATVGERVRRSVVWERGGGICHICGLPADPTRWHLDHIVALANGGGHSYANVAVSHPICNQRKGAKAPPGGSP